MLHLPPRSTEPRNYAKVSKYTELWVQNERAFKFTIPFGNKTHGQGHASPNYQRGVSGAAALTQILIPRTHQAKEHGMAHRIVGNGGTEWYMECYGTRQQRNSGQHTSKPKVPTPKMGWEGHVSTESAKCSAWATLVQPMGWHRQA